MPAGFHRLVRSRGKGAFRSWLHWIKAVTALRRKPDLVPRRTPGWLRRRALQSRRADRAAAARARVEAPRAPVGARGARRRRALLRGGPVRDQDAARLREGPAAPGA